MAFHDQQYMGGEALFAQSFPKFSASKVAAVTFKTTRPPWRTILAAMLARYETIKDFIVLERDLSIETGDLTPTLKLKKKKLVALYGRRLDALYG